MWLLPLWKINDFQSHHCHWMNGLESTHWYQWNGNGFLVWQPLVPMEWRWFSMVCNHWSNDGMVTIHRCGLHTDISARSVTLCSSDLERFKGFRLHNLLPPLSQPRLDLDRGHHCLRPPHHRHHRLLQPDHQEAVPGKLWELWRLGRRGVPGHLHHDLPDRRLPLLLVADLHLPERQVEGWGRLQGFQQPRQPLPLHLPQCLTQGQGCRDFPVPQNSRDTLQFLFFSKIVFQKPCSYFPHDTR